MKCELSLICGYVNETIATSELSKFNYISTENMLPNKNGIEPASSFPNQKVVKAFKKGDILISNIRPYFKKIWFAEYNGGCSNDVLVIRAKKGTNKEFLYYLLSENKFFDYVTASSKGTKMPRGDKNAIMNYLVPEFEEKEQRKIAKLLGTIDKKIKVNKKINDNLLNQALTIYNHKIKPFHKNGCIGDYCTVKSGFAFKSAWWVDKGIKVIKISSINQDYLNIHECSFVSADKQEKAKDFAVTFGDLLIAMTGATIGKFAMVPYTSETLLVNQRVGKFYLGNNPIEKLPFIYCTLKQSDVYTEIIHRGQGSAQANISASDIMNVSCSIPQNDIINEFNYITMPLFNLILKNQYENENLKLLRNTLLPKLMSKNFFLSNIQI